MKQNYYILTTNPRYGKFAFEEDGVKYYAKWYGHHLPAALHGMAIIGKENIVQTNIEIENETKEDDN